MKDIYKGWPRKFIDGLDYLRGKDAVYQFHPVYVKRSTELFASLSSGILDLLYPNNDPSLFAQFTIHEVRAYQRRGDTHDPLIESLISVSRVVADDLRIAENIYGTECLFFCLAVAQRDESEAWLYFHKILRPAVMMRRIRDVSAVMGESGGAPKHRLYGEAMILAMDYQRRHPGASNSEAARYTRSELEVNHKRIPAERTIRDWLGKF